VPRSSEAWAGFSPAPISRPGGPRFAPCCSGPVAQVRAVLFGANLGAPNNRSAQSNEGGCPTLITCQAPSHPLFPSIRLTSNQINPRAQCPNHPSQFATLDIGDRERNIAGPTATMTAGQVLCICHPERRPRVGFPTRVLCGSRGRSRRICCFPPSLNPERFGLCRCESKGN